jgi:transcriptional regulator with XRE-family HTH domain
MPDEADQSLGAQFVRHRVRRGYSQEELAARAGVDQASISRVERNETATTNLIADMAVALGVRLILQEEGA